MKLAATVGGPRVDHLRPRKVLNHWATYYMSHCLGALHRDCGVYWDHLLWHSGITLCSICHCLSYGPGWYWRLSVGKAGLVLATKMFLVLLVNTSSKHRGKKLPLPLHSQGWGWGVLCSFQLGPLARLEDGSELKCMSPGKPSCETNSQ